MGGLGQVQAQPAVVPRQRAVALPEHLARGHQVIEQRGGVVADAGRQDQTLNCAGRQPGAAELLHHAQHAIATAQASTHALPLQPEPDELAGGDGLDFGAQGGQRATAQLAEHVGVAELAARSRRSEFALHDPAGAEQSGDRARNDRGAQAVSARHIGHLEGPMRAGITHHQIA